MRKLFHGRAQVPPGVAAVLAARRGPLPAHLPLRGDLAAWADVSVLSGKTLRLLHATADFPRDLGTRTWPATRVALRSPNVQRTHPWYAWLYPEIENVQKHVKNI